MLIRLAPILMLFLLVSPHSALGQKYLSPDRIGVFFDEYGISDFGHPTAPFQFIEAYLLITRPLEQDCITGWEAALSVTGPAVIPEWTLEAGLDLDPADEYFRVDIGLESLCLPSTPIVHLATWQGIIFSMTDHVAFMVIELPEPRQFDGFPGYKGTDGLHELGDYFPYPIGEINGYDPLHWNPWKSQIVINAGNGILADTDINLISHRDYTDAHDEDEVPVVPRPATDYLRLTFPHPEWNHPDGDDFDWDIRDTYDESLTSKTWRFRVETDHLDTKVTLNFDIAFLCPWPANVRLTDLAGGTQTVFDFWTETYEYMPSPDGENWFNLTIGMPDGATGIAQDRQPATINAYPNPANPSTELSFLVPIDGRVTLHIHDLRGSVVAALTAGDYLAGDIGRVTWRGRDKAGRRLPSGSYVAKMTVNGVDSGAVGRVTLVQ